MNIKYTFNIPHQFQLKLKWGQIYYFNKILLLHKLSQIMLTPGAPLVFSKTSSIPWVKSIEILKIECQGENRIRGYRNGKNRNFKFPPYRAETAVHYGQHLVLSTCCAEIEFGQHSNFQLFPSQLTWFYQGLWCSRTSSSVCQYNKFNNITWGDIKKNLNVIWYNPTMVFKIFKIWCLYM